MIEIQDLEGKVKSEIVDLLLDEKTNAFEIYVPKSTLLCFSETVDIAIDYDKLAYAGQLIKSNSSEFRFDEVPPEAHESVLFDVRTNNIIGLATALFEISFGYVNDCEDKRYEDVEEDLEFWANADQYLSDVAENRLKNIACPYFCKIALQYFDEVANEEQDQ